MLLGDAPRPYVTPQVLQRLWLADPVRWVPQHRLYQFKETSGCTTISLDPIAQILD
jgi:hypothetical protein